MAPQLISDFHKLMKIHFVPRSFLENPGVRHEGNKRDRQNRGKEDCQAQFYSGRLTSASITTCAWPQRNNKMWELLQGAAGDNQFSSLGQRLSNEYHHETAWEDNPPPGLNTSLSSHEALLRWRGTAWHSRVLQRFHTHLNVMSVFPRILPQPYWNPNN